MGTPGSVGVTAGATAGAVGTPGSVGVTAGATAGAVGTPGSVGVTAGATAGAVGTPGSVGVTAGAGSTGAIVGELLGAEVGGNGASQRFRGGASSSVCNKRSAVVNVR